jgi:hypothetical protein
LASFLVELVVEFVQLLAVDVEEPRLRWFEPGTSHGYGAEFDDCFKEPLSLQESRLSQLVILSSIVLVVCAISTP